ncbi:Mitochondrial glycoprotein family protein [Euphorbia peplus]|nr:Mitochondrial glycoprotein family protein [Euphorbia peplus]
MRSSAVQDHILRLIRQEMQYEFDFSPPKQPVDEFKSFKIDDNPGEQWINLKRKFANSEEINLEVTMFDGSIPSSVAKDVTENIEILRLTFIVNISKGDSESLEIMCSGWPDSLEIKKLFIRKSDKMPANAYVGPDFNELDDELQDSVYAFLEERGVDDEMAGFLHQYMKNKERNEYIRWMGTVKSYIEEK